jgi:hypothetical protein
VRQDIGLKFFPNGKNIAFQEIFLDKGKIFPLDGSWKKIIIAKQ